MRTSNTVRKIALVLAVAAELLSFAPAADAVPRDTVYEQQRTRLTGEPHQGLHPICLARDIRLAAGTYDWTVFTYDAGRTIDRRSHHGNMYLGADVYHWTTCIYPQEGYYDVDTYLKAKNHDWHAVSWGVHTYVYTDFDWDYTWGSSLRPLSFASR